MLSLGPPQRLKSQVFKLFGGGKDEDKKAKQTMDHVEKEVFKLVSTNQIEQTLDFIQKDVQALTERDAVGATPIHIAFLYGHHELGKKMVEANKELSTVAYSLRFEARTLDFERDMKSSKELSHGPSRLEKYPIRSAETEPVVATNGPRKGVSSNKTHPYNGTEPNDEAAKLEEGGSGVQATTPVQQVISKKLSPYEGENILHIAIIHRNRELVKWLVEKCPELINAETTGKFFSPGKTCYFGGYPLLYTLSTNQIEMAQDILQAADRLKKNPHKNDWWRKQTTSKIKETDIFMSDSFGNNALHLAVIHDLPEVYDFVLQYVMDQLSPPAPPAPPAQPAPIAQPAQAAASPVTLGTQVGSQDSKVPVNGSRSVPFDAMTSEASPRPLTKSEEIAPVQIEKKPVNLVDFLKNAKPDVYKRMTKFIMHRNSDELTPLSLAAARGNLRMIQHLITLSTSVAWVYGPITAKNIPLKDLEQPVIKEPPTSKSAEDGIQEQAINETPSSSTIQGPIQTYKTVVDVLCSVQVLTNTLDVSHHGALDQIISKRLEIIKECNEFQQMLTKKWKFIGKKRFMGHFMAYLLFLICLNVSTVFKRRSQFVDTDSLDSIETPLWEKISVGIMEVICLIISCVVFIKEFRQVVLNTTQYFSESGAGRLDNICTLNCTTCFFLSAIMRASGKTEAEDAFAGITLIFAWLYLFFFLLGFRSTGPFVIMILKMISSDIVRFICVYSAVMMGFSQALYLVQDGRAGFWQYLFRMRQLVVAGFTGEVNYDDNYVQTRMNPLTQALMMAYILMVMILLVNLLIAMMGNTYNEILVESEQRWVAERANIMSAIEKQRTLEENNRDREKYAIELIADSKDWYLQIEVDDLENWKGSTKKKECACRCHED